MDPKFISVIFSLPCHPHSRFTFKLSRVQFLHTLKSRIGAGDQRDNSLKDDSFQKRFVM